MDIPSELIINISILSPLATNIFNAIMFFEVMHLINSNELPFQFMLISITKMPYLEIRVIDLNSSTKL